MLIILKNDYKILMKKKKIKYKVLRNVHSYIMNI